MLGALLVGNTTIRHALFQGEAIIARGFVTLPAGGAPLPSGWLPRGPAIEAVAVASVNPPRLEEVVAACRGGPPVLVAGRDFPIPIANRYADPSQVGADRLLNSLAASRFWPGEGVVVVDFGTALSVSIVSPSGEFLGGPIAGGAPAIAAGLASRTAQLPLVPPDRPPERLAASSTGEALRSGIYWQVAGAAACILEELQAELPFAFKVVATGGDAPLFAPALPRVERTDGDLALKGLALSYSLRPGAETGGGRPAAGR